MGQEGRGGRREGKGRKGGKDRGMEGKENGDRPPTIFCLKVALPTTACRTKKYQSFINCALANYQ